MFSSVCRSYNAYKMSCFLLFTAIFHTVKEMFTRVFQSKACIFQHFPVMVNSWKLVETHFPAFYHLPYLPVYNAHPCIMRTLIFGTFFFEKKFVIKNPRNQKPKPTLDKHASSFSTFNYLKLAM